MVTVHNRSGSLYLYRSTYCSSAFVFLIILYGCVLVFPAILVHHSYGLWRRLELFSEQPKIDFKKEYLIVTETSNGSVDFWSRPQPARLSNTSPLLRISHSVSDSNLDLKPEHHEFQIDVDLKNVTGIKLLLRMEARLQKLAVLVADCLVWIDHSSPTRGESLTVGADLKLMTSFVMPYKSYSDLVGEIDFTRPTEDVLKDYSKAKAKCVLEGVTKLWRVSSRETGGFKMSLILNTVEQPFNFRPGLAYMFKFAWIQYFSILAILAGIAIKLKKFVFENQIIDTYCTTMKTL
ncbi:transmembrane protein 231 [Galendromus occidentalis]|uniref:Transmembrane protein 231 n=1 Tax=Galendromus occidentalis TaxID=34638 RepID=A0AAJ6QQN5_9ACAR|nr:transmembrane protein 231 [Galendromus occidentalis]